MITLQNSPIQSLTFQGSNFLVKRDDLLHKDFSGNKARKFHYFLEKDFPNIDTIISHGSNQSNAMYSLSVLAKLKGWKFKYYTNHIPSFLEKNPNGNYKYALENGMQIVVGEYELPIVTKDNELFINEGGALEEAKYGIKILADEIKEYKAKNKIEKLKVFLPSGTGTTALYLQKYLDDEVLTCACVGNSEYLKKQFLELESDEKQHPTILKNHRKLHFGKLYKENYEMWQKLQNEIKIEFDLLYDPIGWQCIFFNGLNSIDFKLLYIHQGGLIGNETMIERYIRKY